MSGRSKVKAAHRELLAMRKAKRAADGTVAVSKTREFAHDVRVVQGADTRRAWSAGQSFLTLGANAKPRKAIDSLEAETLRGLQISYTVQQRINQGANARSDSAPDTPMPAAYDPAIDRTRRSFTVVLINQHGV
jgi:hypothetical protein